MIAYVEAVIHKHGFDLKIEEVKTEEKLRNKWEAVEVCMVIAVPKGPEEDDEDAPNQWEEEIEDYIAAATIYWRQLKHDSINFIWMREGSLPSFEEAISLDSSETSVIALSYKNKSYVTITEGFSMSLLS